MAHWMLIGACACDCRVRIGGFKVRYDSSLGGANDHCQMSHLADRLPNYFYSYTPAMSYYKANEMQRVDEGPAIASIFPIVRSDYVLLSRDYNDNRDEHQRLCLYGNFDIVFRPFLALFRFLQRECHPASAVEYALLCAHARWVLTGACNPMLSPDLGLQARPDPGPGLGAGRRLLGPSLAARGGPRQQRRRAVGRHLQSVDVDRRDPDPHGRHERRTVRQLWAFYYYYYLFFWFGNLGPGAFSSV